MSLIPTFEIGFWNAWIFIIPLFVMHIINARVFACRGAVGQSGGCVQRDHRASGAGPVQSVITTGVSRRPRIAQHHRGSIRLR